MEGRARIPGIKENSKKGHDFAARVSVIKEIGSLPWQKKAMNYVFSSNEKTNSHGQVLTENKLSIT